MANVSIEISVPSWKNVVAPDSTKYTVFLIEVAHDCKKWQVERRFKQCEALNTQLVNRFAISNVIFPFAPLITLNKFNVKFIEDRRRDLDIYFKKISHLIIGFNPAETFFGVGDASLPFTLAFTKNFFLPPAFSITALKSFPESLKLGFETILLRGLLGTVYTLITDIQHIEDGIYREKNVALRIGKLDESAERRVSISSELSASLHTLSALLAHMVDSDIAGPTKKVYTFAFTGQQEAVMKQLVEAGEKASSWASSVEEQLLSGLDSSTQVGGVGFGSGNDQGEPPRAGRGHIEENGSIAASAEASSSVVNATKMEKLRKQAEVSLALFVSAQSGEERENGLEAINAMLKVIQTELEVAQIRGTGGVKELSELKDYMLQGKAFQLQDANTLVSQSDIQFFEDTLFSFIDTLSKLEKMPMYAQQSGNSNFYSSSSSSDPIPSAPSENDDNEHHQPKNIFEGMDREEVATKLMKETEILRSSLASSRISLEKHQLRHPEDQSVINLVNRITDIQEHLVEIQYQLKSKFLPSILPPVNSAPRPTRSLDDEFEL